MFAVFFKPTDIDGFEWFWTDSVHLRPRIQIQSPNGTQNRREKRLTEPERRFSGWLEPNKPWKSATKGCNPPPPSQSFTGSQFDGAAGMWAESRVPEACLPQQGATERERAAFPTDSFRTTFTRRAADNRCHGNERMTKSSRGERVHYIYTHVTSNRRMSKNSQ